MRRAIAATAILCTAAAAPAASGRTLHVFPKRAALQSALARAKPGDTILVGSYGAASPLAQKAMNTAKAKNLETSFESMLGILSAAVLEM